MGKSGSGSAKGGGERTAKESSEQDVEWFNLDLSDKDNFRTAAINAFNLNMKPCEKSIINIIYAFLLLLILIFNLNYCRIS